MREATRELGIERTKAQRAVKVAGLAPEAKQAARDAGRAGAVATGPTWPGKAAFAPV